MWDSVADMAVVLAAVVALLPLILAPYAVFYFDITPKIIVLLAGTAVALLLALRAARSESEGLRYLRMILIAQGLSLAVSTLFSTDRALSFGGGGWRRFGLITQVAVLLFTWLVAEYVAASPNGVRNLLRVVAVAGLPSAFYGVLQYFGWDPVIDPAAYHVGEGELAIVRPPGTMGYVSYFATYLLSVIFAGAWLVATERARRWRTVGMAAAGLGTVALVLTGTRAAMLGLVAGTLFLIVWLRPKIRARWVGASAAVLAAMAGFYFSPWGQLLRSRARWFIDDASGGGRPLLWRDSFAMAFKRWPVGWGPETFSIHFPRHESVALARAYPDFYQESPHNIFLDAFASQGTLGLLVLLALTALGFYAVWRSPDRATAACLGAALAAIVVSQQFTAFVMPTALYFYLTVAMLVAQGFAPAPGSSPRSGLVKSTCVALAVLLLVCAVQLFEADKSLAQVSRLIAAGQLTDAAAGYQRMEHWAPPGFRADLWYSRAMAGGAGRGKQDSTYAWQEGLTAAVRASRTAEERQNAWFNLATFYGRQNDFARTEQALRNAISYAPNWYKPHWLLAQVYRAAGQLERARVEAELAADLNGGKNPEVAQTFEQIRGSAHRKSETTTSNEPHLF